MLLKDGIYNRDILIGLPKLKLKNFKCQNITCGKDNQFKKYKNNTYICECGYIAEGNLEIEESFKIKLYCKSPSCICNKTKMDKTCLKCEKIGER